MAQECLATRCLLCGAAMKTRERGRKHIKNHHTLLYYRNGSSRYLNDLWVDLAKQERMLLEQRK